MNNIEHIKNYILFLRSHHDLSVTLHPLVPETLISLSELIRFNIHDNSYCVYLKSCSDAHLHCINRQWTILDKCTSSFEGVCYAGVKEYVYPIRDGAKPIGFISVSGYRCDNEASYINRVAETYVLSGKELANLYHTVLKPAPPKHSVDTLLYPLCDMLELAYLNHQAQLPMEESLPQQMVRYIHLHHTEPVTFKTICREFPYSRSYMSYAFNQYTGMGIREYINRLRIDDAKLLLKNSTLSVTEIALSVGFSNPNYFSSVFKETVGMSPLHYRKSA